MARSSQAVKIAILETKVDGIETSLASLHTKLDTYAKQQDRYKGFWGAVTLLASAVWAAVTYFWPRGN
jgi:hypothetical protein